METWPTETNNLLAVSVARPLRTRAVSWENGLVFVVILLALGITSIPYLYGYLSAPADRSFLGSVGNPGDANTYLAWMRQAAEGQVLFENYYSPEATGSAYFNLLWLALGWLAGALHVDPVLIYEVSRLVLGALFLLVAYGFIGLFFQEGWARRVAFILIALGSGLGWVFRLIELVTHHNLGYGIDFWVPEAFGFFSLLFFPHFVASATLILLYLWGMVRALEKDDWRYSVLVGLAGLTLALVHLYDIVTVGCVTAVYLLLSFLRWRRITLTRMLNHGLLFGGISGIGLGVYAYLATRSPLLSIWASQNALPSPNFFSYLFGFGLIAFAVPFAFFSRNNREADRAPGRQHLLWVWLVVGFLLVYAPVPFNRRFVEGLQFPIVLLGCVGLFGVILPRLQTILERFGRARTGFALKGSTVAAITVTGVVLFSLPTDFVVLNRSLHDLSFHASGYFLSQDDSEAYAWLDKHANPATVVLGSETTGNELPRFADVRIFLGHQQLTYDYAHKKLLLQGFFSTMSDRERQALVSSFHVDYVFWGARETELGRFDPREACFLRPVEQFGTTWLYATQPCASGEEYVR